MKKWIWISFILSILPLGASDQVKDFRATDQKMALVGFKTENLNPEIEKRFLESLRRQFNKYSKSYGTASIQGFQIPQNPDSQYFSPAEETMTSDQKRFLQDLGKNNAVDIIILGKLVSSGTEVEMSLQLFDNRIDTLSKVEKDKLPIVGDPQKEADLVFKVMNCLDRDGFVHSSPQGFLISSQQVVSSGIPDENLQKEFALNPGELAGGNLAGAVSIGGDKVPFWERWWFWTILGGSLVTTGALTYYFLVANQPASGAEVRFEMP